MATKSWQNIVSEKRGQRTRRMKAYSDLLSKERNGAAERVLDIDNIEELSVRLASGRLTSQYVVRSYISKIIEVHEKTNCLTEILFDEAIARAAQLDEYYEEHKQLIGPLHGIPITLKDQFDVKGFDSTIGYVSRALNPASADATIVHILKDLGAVCIAKTNLPQSIMWCETDNPLWGLTVNPRNPNFTPGGSTGGEGAVLSCQASMVGWGTDIGGSIRIPSHMNGLWGLKPTSTRLSYQGVSVSTDGQEHVPSSVGPLARSLSSLVKVMQAVLDARPWTYDPRVTPIPWRGDVFESIQANPLTIGVVYDDDVVKVHPPVERALRELVEKLQAAGHEIVEWYGTGHQECIEIMDLFYSADGGEDIRREVTAGGEPFIPHVERLINRGNAISVLEYWHLNKRKVAAQQKYNSKWNAFRSPSGREVDILLTPTMPHVAVPHGSCRWVGYTKVWNMLDYPALSFPAGKVDKRIDTVSGESYLPRNELDEWNWNLYDPETMDGHPVGLQIIARRFEEEKVLGAAAVIKSVLDAQ